MKAKAVQVLVPMVFALLTPAAAFAQRPIVQNFNVVAP
jgi:hypothetical protein